MKFADPFSPTVEELHEATEVEKMELLDYAIDTCASDSQFGAKLKKVVLALIASHEEVEPPVEPPLVKSTRLSTHTSSHSSTTNKPGSGA